MHNVRPACLPQYRSGLPDTNHWTSTPRQRRNDLALNRRNAAPRHSTFDRGPGYALRRRTPMTFLGSIIRLAIAGSMLGPNGGQHPAPVDSR